MAGNLEKSNTCPSFLKSKQCAAESRALPAAALSARVAFVAGVGRSWFSRVALLSIVEPPVGELKKLAASESESCCGLTAAIA
jgi:hypothetical protein